MVNDPTRPASAQPTTRPPPITRERRSSFERGQTTPLVRVADEDGNLSLAVGDVLNWSFEIRSVLGEGGMGRVYEAIDLALNRRVAIKIALAGGEIREALRREGQSLAAVHHPSTVTVHALLEHHGVPFLVMERVFGVSLRSHIDRRKAENQPFTLAEILQLIIPLTEGLAAVHRAGLSHRDVKPSNIMLAPGDRVVLMDFGLVVPEFVTNHEAQSAGTPGYMAPEVIEGTAQPGKGHLVDLYALGALTYELLTLNSPFVATSTVGVINAQLRGDYVPVVHTRNDVPEELISLVDSLLAVLPHERPQSTETVAWKLRTLRDQLHAHRLDPLRILVVDDDVDVCALLKLKLRREFPQAEIAIANDAQQALNLVRSRSPDVMLLDLDLPGMNGIELCMYLRGTGVAENTLMLAISGNVQEEDRDILAVLGVRRCLSKGARMVDEIAGLIREYRPRST